MTAEILSRREERRVAAKARREARAALRQWSFEALARGWSVEEIADMRAVSPRTIRREIAALTATRPVEAPAAYLQVQIARLNKALRVADGALDHGNLKAVGPMVRLVAALDRYHGLGSGPARRSGAIQGALPATLPEAEAPRALPRSALPLPAPTGLALVADERASPAQTERVALPARPRSSASS